jgi:hypothetical protein
VNPRHIPRRYRVMKDELGPPLAEGFGSRLNQVRTVAARDNGVCPAVDPCSGVAGRPTVGASAPASCEALPPSFRVEAHPDPEIGSVGWFQPSPSLFGIGRHRAGQDLGP